MKTQNTSSPSEARAERPEPFTEARAVRHALIVDDNQDSAEILGMMLQTLGFATDVATNGIDALRKAFDDHPDLILIDICMPQFDGYDTCRVIRLQPSVRNVHLVAVTGKARQEVPTRSEWAGFDDYLLKPVEFEDLRKIVSRDLVASRASEPQH